MIFVANEIKWKIEIKEKAVRKETTELPFNTDNLCLSRKLKRQLNKFYYKEFIKVAREIEIYIKINFILEKS